MKLRRVPEKETRSLREILNGAWESSGKKPPQLDIPAPPEGMGYLLGLYWECKRSAEPIQWHEMEAWLRLTGRDLEPDEIQTLMQLDNVHCRVSREPVSEGEANAALKHEVKARLRAALRGAGK